MATPKKEPKPPADVLDLLAEQGNTNPKIIIAQMLWKARHHYPDLAMTITRDDVAKFRACTDYLEVTPDVRIFRRSAIPARAAQPGVAGKPDGIPGYAGSPAAEFVTVVLVNKGTEDGFKPIENNEDDAQAGERQEKLRRAKENVPQLATMVNNAAAHGDFSQALVMELCEAAMLLAKA
ncbi:hypothetical protein UFOVP1670_5 [uncultured Caudovirales phage]|uniref:Uncharacterized protein n=1 Tax=uncultured Caudovirales phage TaxID=2100421 RepID=A0A6J5T802_9CAUD|nr:hypothetical protein UFOVP1670_5 [uncultured Caudovirales phage]